MARRSPIFRNADPDGPGESKGPDAQLHPRGRDVKIEWTPGRRRYIEKKIDDRSGERRGYTCEEWEDAWYDPDRSDLEAREEVTADASGKEILGVFVVSLSTVRRKGPAEIVWVYEKGNRTSVSPVTIYPPEDASPAGGLLAEEDLEERRAAELRRERKLSQKERKGSRRGDAPERQGRRKGPRRGKLGGEEQE